jgi:hypothetical protein
LQPPSIEAVPADRIIPRGVAAEDVVPPAETPDAFDQPAHSVPSTKREWL